jgi:urease accessory protein
MRTLTRTEVRSSHLRSFRLDGTRVALVPEQAVLLAGDHVTVAVRVGAGQRLEIVEPGGTVAYAMRGSSARWEVRVEVEAGGSLVWHGEPFVVAEGADVRRSTSIDLAAGACLRFRETLVLGRSGEAAGRLVTRTDARREGVPVLVEELDSAVGLGPHRVVDQVLELRGTGGLDRLDQRGAAMCLQLESGDLLRRWLGDATHESPIGRRQSSPSAE